MTLKHVLKLFSKTEVQEDKTHPTPPLEREGVNVSCAEHTVKHLFTFKKVAFTLAEVLITLGIIGVVAALTLPTLIANHQKQTLVNQLKKAVNTIENAARMAVANEGVSKYEETTLYQTTIYDREGYISFYDCSYNYDTQKCDVYKSMINKYFKTVSFAVFYGGDPTGAGAKIYSTSMFVLPDGAYIYWGTWRIVIDVNGKKGPNIFGRDVYSLYLDKDTGTLIEQNRYYVNCKDINLDQLLSNRCYYTKIVADGWKMDY